MKNTNKLQEKHIVHNKYINTELVDLDKSYKYEGRYNSHGSMLVYQIVVMLDGTTYHMYSESASTKGIIPYNLRGYHMTRAYLKRLVNHNNAFRY